MSGRKKRAVDLEALAGKLSDALGFVECALLALQADDRPTGPEVLVLEHGVQALIEVHSDLERAAG